MRGRVVELSATAFVALVEASLELSAELSLLELRAGGDFGEVVVVVETLDGV